MATPVSLFPSEMKASNALNLDSIAAKLTYLKEQTHLLHWQTLSYSEHKATDKLYSFLVDVQDEIVEKMMGYSGRKVKAFKIDPLVDNIDCNLLVTNIISFAKQLQDFGSMNNMPDIENIAQSLSGQAAQTKYLLTLS